MYAFGKNDKAQLGLGDDFVDKEFVRWPTAVPHMKDKGFLRYTADMMPVLALR